MFKIQPESTEEQNISMVDKKSSGIAGYKVKLCAPLPRKLSCSFCQLLMRNPIPTIRGELACEDCYEEGLR